MKGVFGAVLLSIWSAAFALGGAEGARRLEERKGAQPLQTTHGDHKLDVKKPKPLTVPIVQSGKMQGYVVLQLAYSVDSKAAAAVGDVEPYVLDEAFTFLYADVTFDPARLEAYDIDRFKSALLRRIAQRLKTDAVRDVLVQEFNYVAMADLRR
jgi:hypothetical protein